jgi:Fe-S cluster assembly protein SufD
MATAPQDPFIVQALSAAPASMSIAAAALPLLAASQMPSTRVESYRFTDLSPLVSKSLLPPPAPVAMAAATAAVERCSLPASDSCRVVILDGAFQPEMSTLTALPSGVYLGDADSAPTAAASCLGVQSSVHGGVFAQLNSATAGSCLVMHVPEGVHCDVPVHIVNVSSSADTAGSVVASNARFLIVADAFATVEIVEEFVGLTESRGRYFVNTVLELEVAKGAEVKHRVLVMEEAGAFHVKSTFVRQHEHSKYSLTEVRLGGDLTRCVLHAAVLYTFSAAVACTDSMLCPVGIAWFHSR